MNDDDRALARYGDELVQAVESSLGDWIESCVHSILREQGRSIDDRTANLISAARRDAARDVVAELRTVLALDVDEQRKNPLSILRAAVRFPTQVLHAVGAQPVERDEFDEQSFPDDEFGSRPLPSLISALRCTTPASCGGQRRHMCTFSGGEDSTREGGDGLRCPISWTARGSRRRCRTHSSSMLLTNCRRRGPTPWCS